MEAQLSMHSSQHCWGKEGAEMGLGHIPAHCPAINHQLEMELGERSALFIGTEEKEYKQKEPLKS